MLTVSEIAIVRASFQQVLPIADRAGVLVYERIFALAPEARSLFGDDIEVQGKRLMAAVRTVVDDLHDGGAVTAFLMRLGARHAGYGVQAEHFAVVEEALLWTLEQGLGDSFKPDVRAAWTSAWTVMAEAMLLGMDSAQQAVTPGAAVA